MATKKKPEQDEIFIAYNELTGVLEKYQDVDPVQVQAVKKNLKAEIIRSGKIFDGTFDGKPSE